MGNEGSGPVQVVAGIDIGGMCGHLLIAAVGAAADLPAADRDENYQAGLPASGSSDTSFLPAIDAGASVQWLVWKIVTRYGGATALDLSAEANARGSLFFPLVLQFNKRDTWQ